jgi:hypothetical protein
MMHKNEAFAPPKPAAGAGDSAGPGIAENLQGMIGRAGFSHSCSLVSFLLELEADNVAILLHDSAPARFKGQRQPTHWLCARSPATEALPDI